MPRRERRRRSLELLQAWTNRKQLRVSLRATVGTNAGNPRSLNFALVLIKLPGFEKRFQETLPANKEIP
jgi:hypothetical protein